MPATETTVNIASTTYRSRASRFQRGKLRYTTEELALHFRFALSASKALGPDSTYLHFVAMRKESQQRGLRACAFRQFCDQINVIHRSRIYRPQTRKSWSEPMFWPDNSRPANLEELISSLDHASMGG
jgi:hypothetical protein